MSITSHTSTWYTWPCITPHIQQSKVFRCTNTNQTVASGAVTFRWMSMAETKLTSAEVKASCRSPVANITALSCTVQLISTIQYNTLILQQSDMQCIQTHSHIHRDLNGRFPVKRGQPVALLIFFLHLFLTCASFWDRPELFIYFITLSHHVFLELLLYINPSTSIIIVQHFVQPASSLHSMS